MSKIKGSASASQILLPFCNFFDVHCTSTTTETIHGGRGHATTNFRYAFFSFKHLRNQL